MDKVLTGIRVLDFADALAGPYCTRYLADCGAEVIAIEKPGGKQARGIPYIKDGQSIDFLYNHCNKKSIGVDMKKEGAKELMLELAKNADVVVENFRPGVMKGFGLDYPAFREVNPGIIMCSLSGWGQSGPYSERMGADLTTQAESGILDLTGNRDEPPVRLSFPVGDFLGGLNAFGAICAALYRRTITGIGDYIDIALMDCAISVLQQAVGMHVLSGGKDEARRSGRFDPTNSVRGVYKGKDGYIVISAYTDHGFARLAEIMEKPELAKDPRFATGKDRNKNDKELAVIIEEWLQKFGKVADVVALLVSYRMMASPVYTVARVVEEDPQFKLRGMLKELNHPTLGKTRFLDTPLRFTNSKASVDEPPPVNPGENTDEILRKVLNLGDGEISNLRQKGIVFGGA
jgi:CoA:oxalate CoA-transferase